MEGPEGGFEGLDDVAATFDFWGSFLLEGARCDFVDIWREGILLPVSLDGRVHRREERFFRFAAQSAVKESRVVAARVYGFGGAVGGAGAVGGVLEHGRRLIGEGHGDGGEAHEGAVARAAGGGGAAPGIAGADELFEGVARGIADVEAAARGAEVALFVPAGVALELVNRVEAATFDEALREAERHGRVVGPLAGLQVEGAATDHVGDGLEAAGGLEFQGGAHGIADGKTEEAAEVAVFFQGVLGTRARRVIGPDEIPLLRILGRGDVGGHSLSQLGDDLDEVIFRCQSVCNEITTYDGARAPVAAPAVQIDGFILADALCDAREDFLHKLRTWNARVANGKAANVHGDAPLLRQFRGEVCIGHEGLAGMISVAVFHEVDEAADTRIEYGGELLARADGFFVAGIVTRE